MHHASLLVLFALAACSPELAVQPDATAEANAAASIAPANADAPANAEAPAAVGPDVTLEGESILVDTGHGVRLAFDRSTKAEVEAALVDLGAPKRSDVPADCPAGPLDFLTYPNGLELAFLDGKLAGYWVREGATGIATAGGLVPGSPRTALGNARTKETSFAKIVIVDGVVAVLDEKETRITDLYAGLACIYD